MIRGGGGRRGDGETGRLGDGETGRRGDGETGRLGDAETICPLAAAFRCRFERRMSRPCRAPDFGGGTRGFVRASLRPGLRGPVRCLAALALRAACRLAVSAALRLRTPDWGCSDWGGRRASGNPKVWMGTGAGWAGVGCVGLGRRVSRPCRAPDFGGGTRGFVRASLRPGLWGAVLAGLRTGGVRTGGGLLFCPSVPRAGGRNVFWVPGMRCVRGVGGVVRGGVGWFLAKRLVLRVSV